LQFGPGETAARTATARPHTSARSGQPLLGDGQWSGCDWEPVNNGDGPGCITSSDSAASLPPRSPGGGNADLRCQLSAPVRNHHWHRRLRRQQAAQHHPALGWTRSSQRPRAAAPFQRIRGRTFTSLPGRAIRKRSAAMSAPHDHFEMREGLLRHGRHRANSRC